MQRKVNLTSLVTVILGVLISAGIGIFFYFKTEITPAIATFASLLGTIITLQLESSFRQIRTETIVTARERRVSRVERVQWQSDALDRILDGLESVDNQYGSTAAASFARLSIERSVNDLENLKRGRFETDQSNDFPLLAQMTGACKSTMLAVSLDKLDTDWLNSAGGGQTYWNLQVQAIGRGVSIERVFIYDDWAGVESVALDQAAAGVTVLRVHSSKLIPSLQLDMAIWDSRYCCQTTTDPVGLPTIGIYVFDPTEVRRKLEQYEIIKSCSERVD